MVSGLGRHGALTRKNAQSWHVVLKFIPISISTLKSYSSLPGSFEMQGFKAHSPSSVKTHLSLHTSRHHRIHSNVATNVWGEGSAEVCTRLLTNCPVSVSIVRFRFSIVRIVISVSNVTSLRDCLFNCQKFSKLSKKMLKIVTIFQNFQKISKT